MSKLIYIGKQNIPVSIKKSTRAKRMRIAVYCDGAVTAIHPSRIPFVRVFDVLESRIVWIEEKLSFFKKQHRVLQLRHTDREYTRYRIQAKELVKSRLEHFNQYYKFRYNSIYIKNQKTKWGSCSSRKNLTFNYKILFLPQKLQDYLIVHELCHTKEFNHRKAFWDLVKKRFPDYKKLDRQLRLGELD